jgi:hypothetical protein
MSIIDRWTPEGLRLKAALKELDKLEVAVGFQAGSGADENGTDICDIAAWNELGTSRIPSRPFMRQSIDDHAGEINEFMQGMKDEIISGASAETVLNTVGVFQKDMIQQEITNGSFAPNAPATIAKKGSSHPLIDTGRMRQSVNYIVRAKGSGS